MMSATSVRAHQADPTFDEPTFCAQSLNFLYAQFVSNRGTRGRSCCGVGLGMAELPSAACGAEAWSGFAGLRIAGVTGRGRDRWRDDGGRVLGVSRAGRGP